MARIPVRGNGAGRDLHRPERSERRVRTSKKDPGSKSRGRRPKVVVVVQGAGVDRVLGAGVPFPDHDERSTLGEDGYAAGRRFIDYLEPYDADLDLWDDMRSLGDWDEDTVPVYAPCPECGGAEDELRGLHAHATIMEEEELSGGRAFTALVAVSCVTCGWSVNLYGWVDDSSWPTTFGLNAAPVLLSDLKGETTRG